MLRILNLTPFFHLHEVPGGIETHIYELTKYLAGKGFKSIIYASATKQLRSLIQKEELPKIGINIRRFPAIEISTLPFFLKQGYPLPLSLFSEEISKCDIVHLHGQEFLTSFVASVSAERLHKPVVLTIHNPGFTLESDFRVKLLRKILYKTIFSTTINQARAIIVPVAGEFPTLRYMAHKNIFRIPHCVDLDRFNITKKNPEYVLYLGRLEPVKGIEYFVKAIPLILRKVDTDFVIAGHGSMYIALKKFIHNRGMEKHVFFIGGVSYEDVPKIFARASVYAAPGNAGLTLLEAAASCTSIVTANNPWNISILDENSSLIVEEKNVSQLAKAIVTLLQNDELAKRLALKARKFVEEKRSWKTMINKYVNLYKAVVSNDY